MSEKDESDERGFKVADRRRFDERGQARCDVEALDVDASAEEARRGDDGTLGARGTARELPQMDFSTFVLSLSTSALISLGETKLPGGTMRTDLPLAKQTIDILGVLAEKTAGNLTDDEKQLLDSVLYDLRVRYVAAVG
jgi:hypothetical protein